MQTTTEPVPATEWAALPPQLLRRLAKEGIATPDQWLALTPRQRLGFFGITPAHVRLIDAAARCTVAAAAERCSGCGE